MKKNRLGLGNPNLKLYLPLLLGGGLDLTPIGPIQVVIWGQCVPVKTALLPGWKPPPVFTNIAMEKIPNYFPRQEHQHDGFLLVYISLPECTRVSCLITYLGNLQPTYIGVIIHLLRVKYTSQ